MQEWTLGGPGFVFPMSFRVGYRYWVRNSGPWAVQVAKKSARAISTVDNGMDWFFRIPQFLRSILVKWLQKLD